MKSIIRFFSLALTLGAFTFLTGCYTQVATVHGDDDEYKSSAYDQRNDVQDSTQVSPSDNPADYYDQPRYHIGFRYYYPWSSSFYWGSNYDPWYGGFYDPWYYDSWYYSPWRFSPYNYWYSPYYNGGGFYPGYYSYYQPYVVQNRSYYVQRGSGYSRTSRVREGYTRTGTYGSAASSLPNASRYGTSRGSTSSRSGVVPQRNRSTETGVTRGSTGSSRSPAPSTSRGNSGSSRGTSRSGATRGHDQSYSRPAQSYSPPPSGSGSSGSRGRSGSGSGSSRSSGGKRGNR